MKRLSLFPAVAFAACSVFIGCQSANDVVQPDLSNLHKSESLNVFSNLAENPTGDLTTVRLIAGRNAEVGTVTVWNDENNLYVQYHTADGWLLASTHLAAEKNFSAIPQNKPGNPKIGQFEFKTTLDPVTDLCPYAIAFTEKGFQDGDVVCIAAQAEVQLIRSGEAVQEEGAWGEGTSFPGRSNAMYFTHTIAVENGLSDDFEKYAAGSFPSPNWIGSGNGVLPASFVDNGKSMNGAQSLKLYGIPGAGKATINAAGAHRSFEVSPPYFIECGICNGSEPLQYPGLFTRATIYLRTSPSLLDIKIRRLLEFQPMMDMVFGIGGPIGSLVFQSGVWYKVKIKYEITAMNEVQATYWINDVLQATQKAAAEYYETDLKYVSLEAGAGSVWYDDVGVHN